MFGLITLVEGFGASRVVKAPGPRCDGDPDLPAGCRVGLSWELPRIAGWVVSLVISGNSATVGGGILPTDLSLKKLRRQSLQEERFPGATFKQEVTRAIFTKK